MLNNIIEEEDDCFVFFYDSVDPDAHAILAELEGNFIGALLGFSFKIYSGISISRYDYDLISTT